MTLKVLKLILPKFMRLDSKLGTIYEENDCEILRFENYFKKSFFFNTSFYFFVSGGLSPSIGNPSELNFSNHTLDKATKAKVTLENYYSNLIAQHLERNHRSGKVFVIQKTFGHKAYLLALESRKCYQIV